MINTLVHFTRRSLAYFIDGFSMFFIGRIIANLPIAWYGRISDDANNWVGLFVSIFVASYYVGSHFCFGRTIGKLVVGLRVVAVNGNSPDFLHSLLRYTPFAVGGIGVSVLNVLGFHSITSAEVNIMGEGIIAFSLPLAFFVIAEIIVALSKQGRSSIHDMFSGTSVINSKSVVVA
jgi:uncharacterized RDD family membrane protein YckC